MKWLITGGDGQVGKTFQDELLKRDLSFRAYSRNDLDITDLSSVIKTLKSEKFDFVINAAAYTNVEMAESESDLAYLINETGARNIAIASRETNSKLVHFSTDYVFSGARTSPWSPDSDVNPKSEYGRSKLAGEIAVTSENGNNSLIVRTAWLYSPYGKNFYKTMLKIALNTNRDVKVVSDQIGQPTNSRDLVKLLINAINVGVPGGTYHGTNSGAASWYEFAVEIFKLAGADLARVIPVRSSEYVTKVERPSYSVLDNTKWLEFGLESIGPWQESVIRTYSSMKSSLIE